MINVVDEIFFSESKKSGSRKKSNILKFVFITIQNVEHRSSDSDCSSSWIMSFSCVEQTLNRCKGAHIYVLI